MALYTLGLCHCHLMILLPGLHQGNNFLLFFSGGKKMPVVLAFLVYLFLFICFVNLTLARVI